VPASATSVIVDADPGIRFAIADVKTVSTKPLRRHGRIDIYIDRRLTAASRTIADQSVPELQGPRFRPPRQYPFPVLGALSAANTESLGHGTVYRIQEVIVDERVVPGIRPRSTSHLATPRHLGFRLFASEIRRWSPDLPARSMEESQGQISLGRSAEKEKGRESPKVVSHGADPAAGGAGTPGLWVEPSL
jgi:hypothetical protein